MDFEDFSGNLSEKDALTEKNSKYAGNNSFCYFLNTYALETFIALYHQ